MSIRQFLYLCLLTFVVTLSLIIGWRLSDQAMAVIIGVVAGVAASIPTSLLVVWIVLRARSAGGLANRVAVDQHEAATPAPQPQVIFVHTTPAPPAAPQSERSLTILPAYGAPQPTAMNGLTLGTRHFTLLGEDVEDV